MATRAIHYDTRGNTHICCCNHYYVLCLLVHGESICVLHQVGTRRPRERLGDVLNHVCPFGSLIVVQGA